jgi:hypothetical protein
MTIRLFISSLLVPQYKLKYKQKPRLTMGPPPLTYLMQGSYKESFKLHFTKNVKQNGNDLERIYKASKLNM